MLRKRGMPDLIGALRWIGIGNDRKVRQRTSSHRGRNEDADGGRGGLAYDIGIGRPETREMGANSHGWLQIGLIFHNHVRGDGACHDRDRTRISLIRPPRAHGCLEHESSFCNGRRRGGYGRGVDSGKCFGGIACGFWGFVRHSAPC